MFVMAFSFRVVTSAFGAVTIPCNCIHWYIPVCSLWQCCCIAIVHAIHTYHTEHYPFLFLSLVYIYIYTHTHTHTCIYICLLLLWRNCVQEAIFFCLGCISTACFTPCALCPAINVDKGEIGMNGRRSVCLLCYYTHNYHDLPLSAPHLMATMLSRVRLHCC